MTPSRAITHRLFLFLFYLLNMNCKFSREILSVTKGVLAKKGHKAMAFIPCFFQGPSGLLLAKTRVIVTVPNFDIGYPIISGKTHFTYYFSSYLHIQSVNIFVVFNFYVHIYIPGTYVPSIKPAMDAILMILPPFLPLDTDIFSIARNTPRQTPFNMTSRHGSHAF